MAKWPLGATSVRAFASCGHYPESRSRSSPQNAAQARSTSVCSERRSWSIAGRLHAFIMNNSVARTMEVVAGHVPVELVTRPAWERVCRVADCLPAALVQGFYLECRLSAEDAQVDLIVRIERTGREIIAG